MKIRKLTVGGFMGIPDTREFEFPEKIMALCAPNGAGKTTVINALRYALTGYEPDGIFYSGKETAGAKIETPLGEYARYKKAGGKPARYRMDGKNSSLGELNRRLQSEIGGSVENAKLLTSSEVLKSLNAQEFGELLLQFMPEMSDREDVISRVNGATPSMKEIMEKGLPDGDFGSKELDAFFALLKEKRHGVKKEIAELKTKIQIYGGVPDMQVSEQQVKARLEELNKQRDEAVVYEQRLAEYQRIKDSLDRQQAHLKELDVRKAELSAVNHPGGVTEQQVLSRLEALNRQRDEAVLYEQRLSEYQRIKDSLDREQARLKELDALIAEITAVRHSDGERNAVRELMEASQQTARAAHEARTQARAYNKTMVEAAKALAKNECPLSKSLKCTTDKSGLLSELREAANKACEDFSRHNEEFGKAKARAIEAEENLKVIDSDNAAADRREQLEAEKKRILDSSVQLPPKPEKGPGVDEIDRQIESAKWTLQSIKDADRATQEMERLEGERKRILDSPVQLPPKPEKGPDLAELNRQIEDARRTLQLIKDAQMARKLSEQLRAKEAEREDLEKLHDAFSPKGEVKESIIRSYLDAFTEPLNQKVEQIYPEMKVKFISGDGVQLLVDPKGIDKFVPMKALSEGEKAIIVFLLMLNFGELSGLRIIVLDELSVLDAGALDGLLTVLENNQASFDLALLAAVNHDDTVAVFESHHICKIEV